MCELLKVNRSSYYDWRKIKDSPRVAREKLLSNKVVTMFNEYRGRYGARRIKRVLAKEGIIS